MKSSELISKHYPLTSKKVFVINSPNWFRNLFQSLKWALPENNRDTTIFLPQNDLSELREHINDDQIPPEYGGSSEYHLGQHPYEIGLLEITKKTSLL